MPNWVGVTGWHDLNSGYLPQPGDAIVWASTKYPTGAHINLVATVTSRTRISDIGGNQNGLVTAEGPFDPTANPVFNTPNWPGNHILGYVSPPGGTPPPPPTPLVVSVKSSLAAGTPYQGQVSMTGHTSVGTDDFYFHVVDQSGTDHAYGPVPGTKGTFDHPWVFNTTLFANGPVKVYAGADIFRTGTRAFSDQNFSVDIENPVPAPPPPPLPPAPTVSAPSYPVSGTVTLSASDTDPSVTSIQFFANGTPIGTVGAPFQLRWDTTGSGVTYGSDTITAVASNSHGPSPASADVVVYVNRAPAASAATVKDLNGTIHTFTLAKSGGELEETLIAPDGGTTWSCVTCNVGTPAGQGSPAAVIDSAGTIHVYTVAKPYGELEETLLAADGGTAWSCLTCNGGAEMGQGTPSAVIDPSGTVHIYTLAASSGELDETLSAPDGGLTWTCLTCNGGAEPATGAPSAVIDGSGNIHVYTLAISGFFHPGELDETRLPASGGVTWSCLTCNGGAESATGAPSAVIAKNGTIHIYSLAAAGFSNPGELDETLSAPDGGVAWSCLTCNGGAEAAAGAPAALVDGNGTIHVYSYAVSGFFNPGELDETLLPTAGGTTWSCLTCNGGAPVGQGAPAAIVDSAGAVHVFSVASPNGELEDSWLASGGWSFADRNAIPGTPLIGV